jgi:cobalamin-dependent methionine synthase I
LISTTPKGQYHEFGALTVSVIATSCGWRTVYLGPNLPADDIVNAAESRAADAIALSLVYPPDDPNLAAELSRIRHAAGNQIPIIVGGRSAAAYDQVLSEIGAIRIGMLVDLREELDRIKKAVSSSVAGTQ